MDEYSCKSTMEVWNCNKMNVNGEGDVVDDGDDEDATVDDGDRCLGLQDLHSGEDECPSCEFPLQIPFRGEVFASCGVSECWISDESI